MRKTLANSAAKKKRMKELAAKGIPMKAIAERLGMHVMTVYKYLRSQ